MKNIFKYGLATVFILLTFASPALDSDEITIFISLYNKKIYYQNMTEEILIKVSVINNSKETFRFKIADKKVLSLDFEVKTATNLHLPHSEDFIIERGSVQYVYYKDIELNPSEEYSFVLPLNRFIALNTSGELFVQAVFYPGLYTQPGTASVGLRSNIMPIFLRPPIDKPADTELLDSSTGVVLQRQVIPPDEVVDFTVKALKANAWEKYFLYIDVESFILKEDDWRERYRRASEEERMDLRLAYKKFLQSQYVTSLIKMIPDVFRIERTTYDPVKAQVDVIMEFGYDDFKEIKRYSYFLVRKDSYWMIVNYQVLMLGRKGLSE